MKTSSLINQDTAAALVFLVLGAFVLFFGFDYKVGTTARIGPGFFPRVVGCLLLLVGFAQLLRGAFRSAEPIEPWMWRPVIVIGAAFFVFALLIERAGLIITGWAVMALAVMSGHRFLPRQQIPLVILAPVAAAILFIHLLGVPLRYWPVP